MKIINNAIPDVHLQRVSKLVRVGRELGLDSCRLLLGLTYYTGGSPAMRTMDTSVTEE